MAGSPTRLATPLALLALAACGPLRHAAVRTDLLDPSTGRASPPLPAWIVNGSGSWSTATRRGTAPFTGRWWRPSSGSTRTSSSSPATGSTASRRATCPTTAAGSTSCRSGPRSSGTTRGLPGERRALPGARPRDAARAVRPSARRGGVRRVPGGHRTAPRGRDPLPLRRREPRLLPPRRPRGARPLLRAARPFPAGRAGAWRRRPRSRRAAGAHARRPLVLGRPLRLALPRPRQRPRPPRRPRPHAGRRRPARLARGAARGRDGEGASLGRRGPHPAVLLGARGGRGPVGRRAAGPGVSTATRWRS